LGTFDSSLEFHDLRGLIRKIATSLFPGRELGKRRFWQIEDDVKGLKRKERANARELPSNRVYTAGFCGFREVDPWDCPRR
jgi:hypothetical protein